MSRFQTRGMIALVLISIGCNDDEPSPSPLLSIEKPGAVVGLVIGVSDSIADDGAHKLSLTLALQDSRDSLGRSWSDILGKEFTVQLGDRGYPLHLKNMNGGDGTFASESALDESTLPFEKEVFLITSDRWIASTKATFPKAINDFPNSFPIISDRILIPCRQAFADPEPGISWKNTTSGMVTIQIGANNEFSVDVPDSGKWVPPRAAYEPFFQSSVLASIDQALTQTDLIQTKLSVRRSAVAPIRVSLHNQTDRTLSLIMIVQESLTTGLRYVGGCNSH